MLVLLSHRLGQVWIFGTTGDIPCPSVLSNKVAGQSQFSTPYDHLFRTIRSFFFFLPVLDIFLCHFPINFFLCFLLSCGPFYGQYILLPLTPPAANIARLDHLLFQLI